MVAGRRIEALGEGARLVAVAVGAVVDGDVDASPPPLAGPLPGEDGGVVGGIVEDLDLEKVAGMRKAAGSVDEALDDVPLVVDGELDRDAGVGGGVGDAVGRQPPGQEEQTDPVGREGKQQGQDGAVERHRDDAEDVGHSGWSLGVGSNPRHRSTGSGGYLGKVGSSRWRPQSRKTDPRREVIRRIQAHRAQRPTGSAGVALNGHQGSGILLSPFPPTNPHGNAHAH